MNKKTIHLAPFLILTGLSGAGKSTALRILEDLGFLCIDHLPLQFLHSFIQDKKGPMHSKTPLALHFDARDPLFPKFLEDELPILRKQCPRLKLIFLKASSLALMRRFSETRRPHPLSFGKRLPEAIQEEIELLSNIEEQADELIDTTACRSADLRFLIEQILLQEHDPDRLAVGVFSFAYRHGLPITGDLIFDLRFLPNPYFIERLRSLNGTDKKVRDFVLRQPETRSFIEHLQKLFDFLLPHYLKERRSYLTIAFGCTGGQHRSVSIATYFAGYLKKKGFSVSLEHRDL